jgi:hypothetical protein
MHPKYPPKRAKPKRMIGKVNRREEKIMIKGKNIKTSNEEESKKEYGLSEKESRNRCRVFLQIIAGGRINEKGKIYIYI